MAEEKLSNNEQTTAGTDNAAQEATNSTGFDLGVVIERAKAVVTAPISFYKTMPTSGGYAEPIIFVVVMSLITAIVAIVFGTLGLSMAGLAVGISSLIFIPIFSVIGSFIGAAILFVIWKLMGSDKDYETAYRCAAYAFAISPIMAAISFIPYIAGIIQKVWGAILMFVASTEVHKLKASTAKVVFGILAALGILFGISTEKAARDIINQADNWRGIAEEIEKDYKEGSLGEAAKKLENFDELTPEEAGKQVGEFLKGLEKFSKGVEQSATEKEPGTKPE